MEGTMDGDAENLKAFLEGSMEFDVETLRRLSLIKENDHEEKKTKEKRKGISQAMKSAAQRFNSLRKRSSSTSEEFGTRRHLSFSNDEGSSFFCGFFYEEKKDIVDTHAGKYDSLRKKKFSFNPVRKSSENYYSSLGMSREEIEKVESLEFPSFPSKVVSSRNLILALTASGEIYSKGGKDINKCFLGKNDSDTISSKVSALEDQPIIDINVGPYHCLAATSTSVFAWGKNTIETITKSGIQIKRLGNRNAKEYSLPQEVEGIEGNIKAVSCGEDHSCVLTSKGIYSWGLNDRGQLGRSGIENQPTLIHFSSLETVLKISCGGQHVCVLTEGEIVYSWGDNSEGQLGIEGMPYSTNPIKLESVNEVFDISTGSKHTAILTSGGEVYTFGSNIYGQLGRKRTSLVGKMELPKQSIAYFVNCGEFSTAVIVDGELYVCGYLMGEGMSKHEETPKKFFKDKKNLIQSVAM